MLYLGEMWGTPTTPRALRSNQDSFFKISSHRGDSITSKRQILERLLNAV